MIDYINVRANNTVVARQYLADSNKAVADHTDFIQLIPTAEYCDLSQYALAQLDGVSYFEESDWIKMNEYLIDVSVRMEKAFREPIKKLNNYMKNK